MNISEIREKFPQYSDIPDGELVRGLHRRFYSDVPYADFLRQIDFSDPRQSPASEMTNAQRFNAGVGKAFYDIGSGASQLVGSGESPQELSNRRELDRPLMRTGAGMAGNVAGNITALAPLAVVPGANTIAGAGALGMSVGALQPATGFSDRAKNMAVGAGLGAGAQYAGSTLASNLGSAAAAREAERRGAQSQKAVIDETLRRGRDAGYVVPPSSVRRSWINERLEGIAGKAAVGQEAARRNQPITDALARQESGLGQNQPLSLSNLRGARTDAAEPYRQIASISPEARAQLDAWKTANNEARLQWDYFSRTRTPDAYKAAQAADEAAETALNNIEQIATQTGRNDLVSQLRDARVQIAKIHGVESSVNRGTGSIDPSVLGRQYDSGAPLTGGLETVARMQQAFPSYMREASRVPTPGVSQVEPLAAGMLASTGAAAGGPIGILAGGLPLLRTPARNLVLSRPYQNMMLRPDYSPGLLELAAQAAGNDRLGILSRSAVPAAFAGD